MEFVPPALTLALPELVVAAMTCVVLVAGVFLPEGRRGIGYGLAQLTVLLAALATLYGFAAAPETGFHGHYVRDPLGDCLKLAIYGTTAVVFLYSRDYLRWRGMFQGEYFVLGLFGLLGMMIMVSARSFLSLYLGLELLSLSLYAMVAFDRGSAVASEAAMKYFVLGALASGMLLYGISMVYGATGSVEIGAVARAVEAEPGAGLVLVFGLVFLVVGLAFKLGAVPFHMWLPDVYQGAPTSVTLYLGGAPKLAAFAIVMRVLVDGLGALHVDWQPMLVVLATLSIAAGNLVALVQTNFKRLMAYSTISHVGFLLLGVLAGTPAGYAAALFYAVTYVVTVVGSFGVLLALGRQGWEAERIEDFRGLNERSPWLALIMLLLMASTAGIPVLVGFYAKLAVLMAVVEAGLLWLAVFGVVFSVVGAFYYLRIIWFMYFEPAEETSGVSGALDTRVVLSLNGGLVLALGIYPGALLALCQRVTA